MNTGVRGHHTHTTTLFLAIGTAMAVCLAVASSLAFAADLTEHSFVSSFDGTGSTEGKFQNQLVDVATHEDSSTVYVATKQAGLVIDKFDSAGSPVAFSNPSLGGATSLNLSASGVGTSGTPRVIVDNSPTPTNGRIYVSNRGGDSRVWAFEPDGALVGGNFPINFPTEAIAVDPIDGHLWIAQVFGDFALDEYTTAGVSTGERIPLPSAARQLDIDSDGNFYVHTESDIRKYDRDGDLLFVLPFGSFGDDLAVDVTTDDLYVTHGSSVVQYNSAGSQIATFGSSSGARGVAVDGTSQQVYVGSGAPGERVDIYGPAATVSLPEVATGAADEFMATSIRFHGTVDPDGVDTSSCRFEWSTDGSFGNSATCDEGDVLSGSSPLQVSAEATGLTQGQSYHYRLLVSNANGTVIGRQDHTAIASSTPLVEAQWTTDVHTDEATIHASIVPGGADSVAWIEYGPGDCETTPCQSTPHFPIGAALSAGTHSVILRGFTPGALVHYRIVGENQSGITYGDDQTFRTFPQDIFSDSCPNAHVRQQTGAALLANCRAYELVSAVDTGGYNVESTLVPGQEPFDGYPGADDRVLYGVHDGAIPGNWDPTNRGVDPYVATRTAQGWTTQYVGIPADAPSSTPFSSELAEADPKLDLFAFAGPSLCSPCFSDGSTGMPVSDSTGDVTQGMLGSQEQLAAVSDGFIGRRFSSDRAHVIFGTTAQLEPQGNSNGDVTIYDRNLETDVTQVVSTDPSGAPLACLQGTGECHSPGNAAGISELDVSEDGARIVVGQKVSTDPDGNNYLLLYMHIGVDPNTVPLNLGATDGALFDGMTADGSRVFMTTTDSLDVSDTDESADIYEASVDETGSVALRLLSTKSGTPSNDDSCSPPGAWNAVSGKGKCNVVALAGGAGLAEGDGTFYFVSPELLDSAAEATGQEDQPNLYVVRPGDSPVFVATIDSSQGKPIKPLESFSLLGTQGSFASVPFVAADPSDGSVYLADEYPAVVKKYDEDGNLITSWATGGELVGENQAQRPFEGLAGIAVDTSGNLLVYQNEFAGHLYKFAPDGTYISDVPSARGTIPAGIAADSAGNFYKVTGFGSVQKFDSTGTSLGQITQTTTTTGLAVDSSTGDLYIDNGNSIDRYAFDGNQVKGSSSNCTPEFNVGCPPTSSFTAPGLTEGKGLTVDPDFHELFVNNGDRILRLNASGSVIETIGLGTLSTAAQVTLNTGSGKLYATDVSGGNVLRVFRASRPPVIDHPAILHGVHNSSAHDYGDFQTSTSGDYAVFGTAQPVDEDFDNARHFEIYRYAAGSADLDCVSCNPTGARAVSDAFLGNGLSISDSGDVYFDTGDALTARDLNDHRDVYEWEGADPQLVSTGGSPFDSKLLGADAAGEDVYFFTRDLLVPEDENGSLVKIYDARAGGGYPYRIPAVPCKASDECHGAGSEQPGPLPISTIRGTGGNHPTVHCRRGTVRKRGRCVKKHRRHGHHRGGRGNRHSQSTRGNG